jgi:hypothetical protein
MTPALILTAVLAGIVIGAVLLALRMQRQFDQREEAAVKRHLRSIEQQYRLVFAPKNPDPTPETLPADDNIQHD